MAIKDDDLLYVQRPSGPDAGSYKTTVGNLLENGNYLSLDAAAGPQTVESPERVTFTGATEFSGGFSVNGKPADFDSIPLTSNLYPLIWSSGKGALKLQGRVDTDPAKIDVNSTVILQNSDSDTGVTVSTDITNPSRPRSRGVGINTAIEGDPKTGTWSRGRAAVVDAKAFYDNATGPITDQPFAGISAAPGTDTGNPSDFKFSAFVANTPWLFGNGPVDTIHTHIGFESLVETASASDAAFSFFSRGDAPSFHKGDFHIGGDHTRNSYDEWLETLTDQQLFDLSEGNLAVPAEVNTTNTRDFGDNTNIKLTADGDIIAQNFRIDLLQELV
jgi:hypothetical protein